MREPELRNEVNRLGIADALQQRVRSLVHERHQDAIRDEAREVARLGGLLTEVARQLHDRGRSLVRRLNSADHLDELQHRHRVEEVHADHADGPSTPSARRKRSSFAAASSVIASIIRSASTSSAAAVIRPSTSAGSPPPLAASLPRLRSMPPSPRSPAPGYGSCSET